MESKQNIGSENTNLEFEAFGAKILCVPSKRKKVRKVNITVEGNFNLGSVSFVYEKINQVFENYDLMDLNLKNLQQLDLAALQMLHYFKKNQAALNKHISVDAELSPEAKAVFSCSGMLGLLIKTKLIE